MTWKETYDRKHVTIEEAVSTIRSGDTVFVSGSTAIPYAAVNALADRAPELKGVNLIGCMALSPLKIFSSKDYKGRIDFTTFFYSAYDKVGYKNGNVHIVSVSFSKLSRYLVQFGRPNVLMVEMSEPDEEGYLHWGPTGVAWNGEVAEAVDRIIAVVNKHQGHVSGRMNKIHVSRVNLICRDDHPLPELVQPKVEEIDQTIANLILDYIPDGATLQLGLGGLANAIGYGLEEKKGLSIHTEMLTDSMVELAKKGVISGKILAAFALGNQETYGFVKGSRTKLAPISCVNDPAEIGKNENFISINSCLMADLTGQVCSESIGFRQFSCIGGQLDFVKGAAMSKGGKSFLCMHSTRTDEQAILSSRICFSLPEGAIVTTPRAEVMYVVTEYGVADLYLKPIEQRINAMISIAHPRFREELRAQAAKAGMLSA